MSNLIEINGENHKIAIKAGYNSLKNGTYVAFDTPFENSCLAVLLTNVAYTQNSSFTLQAVASDSMTNEGFKFLTNISSSNNDTFYYLAIGY